MFFGKKRWICEEAVQYLLSLKPIYYVNVNMNVDGRSFSYPFRSDSGELMVDLYDRNVASVDVDYMKNGCPILRIYVGKEGLEKSRFPDVKEKVEDYMSRFPSTQSNANLKQLHEMQEGLRSALCDSMKIDFVRDDKDEFSSIFIDFSKLSPEQKKRVCDLVCNLDGDAVDVSMHIMVGGCDEERIYATLEELALYDAAKDAEFRKKEEGPDELGL